MNKDDVVKYVRELDWSYPIETQNKAVDFLSKADEEYIGLIFDKKLKSTWENAVKVIKKMGFPKINLCFRIWCGCCRIQTGREPRKPWKFYLLQTKQR